MASRDLIRAVLRTAAATAFGGPVAGAGTAVGEAIDLLTGGLGRRDKDLYASAIKGMERDLGTFAASEGLPRGAVDAALEAGAGVIAAKGLTARR